MTSLPRGSLASFMQTARNSLHSAIINNQRVTLVMGSDSGDQDGIISAIVLAYIHSTAPSNTPLTNSSVNRHQPPNQYPSFYIPLVNQSRQAITGRNDLSEQLSQADLELKHLITLDDLKAEPPAGLNPDNTSMLRPESTRLILTGCQMLSGRLSPDFQARVAGYIDNHESQKHHTVVPGNEPRICVTTAACTSLVVDHCRMAWDVLSENGGLSTTASTLSDVFVGIDDTNARETWDKQAAIIALMTILQATDNLMDETKTTSNDRKACEYLKAKIALGENSTPMS